MIAHRLWILVGILAESPAFWGVVLATGAALLVEKSFSSFK